MLLCFNAEREWPQELQDELRDEPELKDEPRDVLALLDRLLPTGVTGRITTVRS